MDNSGESSEAGLAEVITNFNAGLDWGRIRFETRRKKTAAP
jgi:hypothetical protein